MQSLAIKTVLKDQIEEVQVIQDSKIKIEV